MDNKKEVSIRLLFVRCEDFPQTAERAFDCATDALVILRQGIDEEKSSHLNASRVMLDHLLRTHLDRMLMEAEEIRQMAAELSKHV